VVRDAYNRCCQFVGPMAVVVRRHLDLEAGHDGQYSSDVIVYVIASHVHRYITNRCNLRTLHPRTF